ncbi:kinase-like domain-containing protein [Catenaria anguillulae PL171]|uniref:Serine/threonine-protein kinase TEL1 n=1 Tax=Catenaria anguillulae PL171 TaxID=765915 RepID=A0A1Y2HY68_9FUNG|nr:kinase-like domain-containing protein [Catenaria anguillulae PL171]
MRMAKILKRAGKWYSDLKLLPATIIVESYLAKATKFSPTYSGAFHALAQFAHRQYKNMSESEALSTLESQLATYRRDLQAMKAVQWPGKPPQDFRARMHKLEQQIIQDRAEVKIMREQCSVYVRTAVDNYMQALATSDQHDLDVYSLCSLWLSTAHDDKLNHIVLKRLHHVPPRKFICLTNQLTARLGCELDKDHDLFKRTLYAVVQYVLVNHPHHILYNLIALSNGDVTGYLKDEYSITDDLDESVKARIATVGKLLDDFKVKHPLLYEQYQIVTEAYIEASYRPLALRKNVSSYPLTGFKIAKLRNLEGVPVATAHIPLNVGPVRVDGIPFPPYIHRFLPDCMIPGGVNQPKAINCIGSNGIIYKQLVKGNDDLRQDAGLMHVFQVADQLLAKHEATRTRQLSMRTYKVIPLAPQAGLLEWVDNTRPLFSVLSDLHGQWSRVDGVKQLLHTEARMKLGSVQHARAHDKIRVFKDEILPVFRPVFHNWFLAQDTAEEWFNKRLAFTRSLAVTSIVGYIVGLGDRHPSNILFDERTATLIHIDLGISFDAGSLLPIPEVVPFRLTQNLVDAMGPSGVEGVFRRCCEETLRVLRLESHVLYTILEVFKYDPLHNWTDPQKMARAQAEQAGPTGAGSGDSGRQTRAKTPSQPATDEEAVTNKEAERALAGVRRKLGHRDSVECQVSELIQEATSKENLAVLFQGWQPYF